MEKSVAEEPGTSRFFIQYTLLFVKLAKQPEKNKKHIKTTWIHNEFHKSDVIGAPATSISHDESSSDIPDLYKTGKIIN